MFLFGGVAIATAFSFFSDPDPHGLSTMLSGLALLQGVWAIAASHLARKALIDHDEADQKFLFSKASEHPIGAGLALVALSIIFVGLLFLFAPRAHAQSVPENFLKYGAILKSEQKKYWPADPEPSVLAGLIEQETCITLKSSSCWNPAARLKTSREEGAGLGQITRAYKENGALRFDSLAAIRSRYPFDLGELSWSNIYSRPDLQLRAVVILSRDLALPFRFSPAQLAFGDAAYNGGIADVQMERRACQIAEECDASQWFNHVELHCLKSRQPIYAGRSACDINREHVRNVLLVRKQKYVPLMID